MACRLYNNDGFKCGGCKHFYKTVSVTLVSNVLRLAIQPTGNLTNKEKFCICIAQPIPEGVTSANSVFISINGVGYPLRTRCGNNVAGDQVRSRMVLHTNIATDGPTFVVGENDLCRTNRNFPIITVTTATTETPETPGA